MKSTTRIVLILYFSLILISCVSSFDATASVFGFVYSPNTATVQSPTATLQTGNSGSSVVPSQQTSGTVTITAGLTYYENASAPSSGTTPTVDTSLTTPSSTGSNTVLTGSSIYLWSPQYTASSTLYSGTWVLDLWASATVSNTIGVSIFTTDSTGTTQSTILSGGTTNTIGITKGEVLTSFSGNSGTIPANGYIKVALTVQGGLVDTIYWGSGQLTNFQTVRNYDYVLSVVNNAGSKSWNINLGVASTTSTSRIYNFTTWFHSPVSTQITLGSGVSQLSVGPAVSLPVSSTIRIAMTAVATTQAGNSTIIMSLKVLDSVTGVYSQYTITVTVS